MNTTSHLSDDMLNAWIDGMATEGECGLVAEHLAVCATCRAERDSLLQVKQILADLPEPALPRSFQLTADQARKPTPIREAAAAPSAVIRILPIVRVLSIAAVLALLVLGGASALGPVPGDNPDSTSDGVTNQSSGASEETYPAPMANAPGEVVDQGQAASSSNSAISAMGNGLQESSPDNADGRSALEIATISTGVFAVIMVGLWVVLHQMSRARPARQEAAIRQG